MVKFGNSCLFLYFNRRGKGRSSLLRRSSRFRLRRLEGRRGGMAVAVCRHAGKNMAGNDARHATQNMRIILERVSITGDETEFAASGRKKSVVGNVFFGILRICAVRLIKKKGRKSLAETRFLPIAGELRKFFLILSVKCLIVSGKLVESPIFHPPAAYKPEAEKIPASPIGRVSGSSLRKQLFDNRIGIDSKSAAVLAGRGVQDSPNT